LELKKDMDEIVNTCFENDIHFQNQRDNGFKLALNQNDKSPGFMATFLDFQFVKGAIKKMLCKSHRYERKDRERN